MKRKVFGLMALHVSLVAADPYFTCHDREGGTVISDRPCAVLKAASEPLSMEHPPSWQSQDASGASAHRVDENIRVTPEKLVQDGDGFSKLLRIASRGDKEAQYRVGSAYRFGMDGVPANPVEAQVWLTRAADQGHVQAQSDLGRMYYEGVEGEVDLVRAKRWLTVAANSGDKPARDLLQAINAQMARHRTSEGGNIEQATISESWAWLLFACLFIFLPLLLLSLTLSARRQHKKFEVDPLSVLPELISEEAWKPLYFDYRLSGIRTLLSVIGLLLLMTAAGCSFVNQHTEVVYQRVLHIPLIVWKLMMLFLMLFSLYAAVRTALIFKRRHEVGHQVILHETCLEAPNLLRRGNILIPYSRIRNVRTIHAAMLPSERLLIRGAGVPNLIIGSMFFNSPDEYLRFKRLFFGLVVSGQLMSDTAVSDRRNNPRKW